ncbi:MAG: SHOCT domain-containing protein [Glutamicibacter ardleyensis]
MNQNDFSKRNFPKISVQTPVSTNRNPAPKDHTWIYLLVIGVLMGILGIAMGSNRSYGSLTSFQAGNGEGIAAWILTVVGILLVIIGIAVVMMQKEPTPPSIVSTQATAPVAPAPVVEKPIKGKLQELNELLNDGLISQQEYDKKRRDLLDKM